MTSNELRRGMRVRFICRGMPDQAALVLRVIEHARDLMAVELLVFQNGNNPQHRNCVVHVSKADAGAPMSWDWIPEGWDWDSTAAA